MPAKAAMQRQSLFEIQGHECRGKSVRFLQPCSAAWVWALRRCVVGLSQAWAWLLSVKKEGGRIGKGGHEGSRWVLLLGQWWLVARGLGEAEAA